MKKLQLKKDIVARLNKEALEKMVGGQYVQTQLGCDGTAPTPTLRGCLAVGVSAICDSDHVCNVDLFSEIDRI